MLDLETYSTRPNAVILTIGAVKFNRYTGVSNSSFYRRIDISSCKKLNMDIDPNTEEWWEKQDEKVRNEAIGKEGIRIPIKKALEELATYVEGCKYIWAKSPSFDCVILTTAYQLCNLSLPWKFWQERDCRTLYWLVGLSNKEVCPEKGAHNALQDCYAQIKGVQLAFSKLRIV